MTPEVGGDVSGVLAAWMNLDLFVGAPSAVLAHRRMGTLVRMHVDRNVPDHPLSMFANCAAADRTSGDQEGHRVVPTPRWRKISVALHS